MKNKKPLKRWSAVLMLFLAMYATAGLFCALAVWIITGGDLAKAFTDEHRIVIEKTVGIGGFLFGGLFGLLLWTRIMIHLHSPDEVKRFSDTYLSGVGLNRVVNAYLRRFLDKGSRD